MLFNSFEFILFLPLSFVIYWSLSKSIKKQNLFLLAASYLFYGWWDWRFLFLILFSSLVDYYCGISIAKAKSKSTKKKILSLSLLTNLGLLGVFKYFNFFSLSFAQAFASVGIHLDVWTLNVILPVGISFYTFQTLSYTLDIYRGNLKPTNDIISFLAYVSFFPQLVAGPIERASNLLPQFIKSRSFNYDQAMEGIVLIVWGFFKKLVIADNCSVIVNAVFNNYQDRSGIELLLAVVFFAFQIYCDFSGYSDIARGVAKLFGFELMINFMTPYFARDIAEFWRRWHISLTTWFRDYLYIPLGGSKNGKKRVLINTFIIFIVSGFWHGANWTFIAWGLLNAILFIPLMLLNSNRNHLEIVGVRNSRVSIKEVAQIIFTFMITCVAWIFFRSATLADAVHFINSIFSNSFYGSYIQIQYYFVSALIIIFLILEWHTRETDILVVARFKVPLRNLILSSFVLFILLFGNFSNNAFIYFQF